MVAKRAQVDAQFPLPTETMDLADVKISVWETLTYGDLTGATKTEKIRKREGAKHILEIKRGR